MIAPKSADTAHEGPFVRVNALMPLKIGLGSKGFGALVTMESGFFVHVTHVECQSALVNK
jgi:hypothetical protein